MSVDRAFRQMIRQEIDVQLRPLRNAMAKLEVGSSDLSALRDMYNRLAPLSSVLGGAAGKALGRRGPGRPKGSGRGAVSGRRTKRTRAEAGANDRLCALSDCRNKARSKGYCAAHYQKFRNLSKTDRLPSDWKEYAPPGTVTDVVLPRGRAAAKALKAARSKRA